MIQLPDTTDSLAEVSMTPTSFAASMQQGQESRVRVGFEFEVQVPYSSDVDSTGRDSSTKKWKKTAGYTARQIKATYKKSVIVFTNYHEKDKDLKHWYIEPDGSLNVVAGHAALEIVSPPYRANAALRVLRKFYALARNSGYKTDSSTGLHINISIPKKTDLLKLALFLGDEHVLQKYYRSWSTYAESVIRDLPGRAENFLPNSGLPHQEIDYDEIKSAINDIMGEHYASVVYTGKYFSFRHVGGDYLAKEEDVVNTLGRFVRALLIASDKNAYREEYLKKLYKIASSRIAPSENEQLRRYRQVYQYVKSYGLPMLLVTGVSVSDNRIVKTNRFMSKSVVVSQIFGFDRVRNNNSLQYHFTNISAVTKNPSDTMLQNDRNSVILSLDAALISAAHSFMFESAYMYSFDWNEIPRLLDYSTPVVVRYDYGPESRIYYNFRTVNLPPGHPKVTSYLRKMRAILKNRNVPDIPISSTIGLTRSMSIAEMQDADTDLSVDARTTPIYYFAYGMLTDHDLMTQLGAQYSGKATLGGYKFVLYGHANVIPNQNSSVVGALWQIDSEILRELDRIEGYPSYYERVIKNVSTDSGEHRAIFYVMSADSAANSVDYAPTRRYVEQIAQGYRDCEIPLSQLNTAIRELNHRMNRRASK